MPVAPEPELPKPWYRKTWVIVTGIVLLGLIILSALALSGEDSYYPPAAFRSDLEEGREENHQQELATGETPFIVSHVVPVDGYTYVDATEFEIRNAIASGESSEELLGVDLLGAVSLHGVVADDPLQNTANRSDFGQEAGFLVLTELNEPLPYGLDQQVARSLYGGTEIDRLEIAGIPVFVFENPAKPDSRYTYVWFEHGVMGFIDGADRDPLELWLAAYLDIPKLNEHETAKLHARLTEISGFRYIDTDASTWEDAFASFGDIAHSAHGVANTDDGTLGTLFLAETEDTAPYLEVFDLEVVGEIELGGQQVQTLEGTDGYAFIWSESGISGALGTNAADLESAKLFLEAFLDSEA